MNRRKLSLLPLVVVMFTVGIVSGAVSLFYVPEGVFNEVKEGIVINSASKSMFPELFMRNLFLELIWIIAVWILGNTAITTPLAVGVISLRGFILGFSVSFICYLCENKFELILKNVVPQTLFAVPLLTIFVVLTVNAVKRKSENIHYEKQSLTRGAVFILLSVVVAIIEAFSNIFINL